SDFDFTSLLDGRLAKVLSSRKDYGTPFASAPELQINGTIGLFSDMWALGIMLKNMVESLNNTWVRDAGKRMTDIQWKAVLLNEARGLQNLTGNKLQVHTLINELLGIKYD